MAVAPTPKVSIDVRIGKFTRRGEAKNDEISDGVHQAILNMSTTKAVANRAVDVGRVQGALRTVVEREYGRGINTAISSMIGRTSPESRALGAAITFVQIGNADAVRRDLPFRADTTRNVKSILPPRGSLRWRSLQSRTVMDKGHRKFFVNTGALKAKLKNGIRQIVEKTGVVKVQTSVKRNVPKVDLFRARPVLFGDLTIRLIPRVPRSLLPGLRANNFGVVDHTQGLEKMLIDDPGTLEKLYGHKYAVGRDKTFQRPLLQPVFTYWTQYNVPARIAAEMRKILG